MPTQYRDFMEEEKECPFCHRKESDVIMESKHAYATYALAPYHKDHLLVIPKRHVTHILDLTPEEQHDIDNLMDTLWQDMQKKFKYKDVSFLVRDGKGSGASVEHTHYHIIPETKIGDFEHDPDNRNILGTRAIKNEVERIKAIV
ncbi:MAG: DUF4931 domain-containing protein [Patescibacteria group bacterium]